MFLKFSKKTKSFFFEQKIFFLNFFYTLKSNLKYFSEVRSFLTFFSTKMLFEIWQNAKTTDQKAALKKKTSIKSPPLIYRAK